MLLTRTYSSGHSTHLTEEQQEMLRSELNKPKGFSSYQEIVDYIEKTFGVKMNYKAVYDDGKADNDKRYLPVFI